MTIKVLIADDHDIIRDGLKALIDKKSGMEVIAEAKNGRQAVQLAVKLKPDVIVMDISMPELNGIDASRQIMSELPSTKIIALSIHTQKRFVVGMFKAGVSAYLPKYSASEELFNAISTVMKGQIYISPKIAGVVIKDYLNRLPETEKYGIEILTEREREVLQLIAEGSKTKDIATKLHVSVSTVETHRRQIMEKLNLFSIAELTKFALKEGLISLDT
ncbi:MAG: response regulator transcription factor [Desulfobacterales bacterium]|nr:response regulator transcription factor [Desulfobacterales bacterium]